MAARRSGYEVHPDLGPLEDRESVQSALPVVINALATCRIDTRRATALLYGLQLASSNAARLNSTPNTPEVVRAVHSSPEGLDPRRTRRRHRSLRAHRTVPHTTTRIKVHQPRTHSSTNRTDPDPIPARPTKPKPAKQIGVIGGDRC